MEMFDLVDTPPRPSPPSPGQYPGQNQGSLGLIITSSTWFRVAMEGLGSLTSLARVSLPRGFWDFFCRGLVFPESGFHLRL